MTDAEHEDDSPFIKIDGKLYYRDSNGSLIGPPDPPRRLAATIRTENKP